MRKENKALFKFNKGIGALLCSSCSKIIKTGRDMNPLEKEAMRGNFNLEPQYCDECINENECDASEFDLY